jgi:hypothetical protein
MMNNPQSSVLENGEWPAASGREMDMVPALSAASHADAESTLGNAITFTQAQDDLLQKFQSALERVQTLAAASPENAPTDPATPPAELQTLANYLRNLAAVEMGGRPLFDGSTLAVETDGTGNKLIMAGVNLRTGSLAPWNKDSGMSLMDATQGRVRAQTALQRLAVERSIVAANLGRLAFLSQNLDTVKDRLAERPGHDARLRSQAGMNGCLAPGDPV